mmetsp:Transcript_25403/g.44891  ORF Transcript_25403/g.44891 Transcript_25403/m.44891 type:complete len:604 (-) Transcript_25403:145-1956(-)
MRAGVSEIRTTRSAFDSELRRTCRSTDLPVMYGGSRSHRDLHSIDVIEDKSRRNRSGLPTRYQKRRLLGKGGFAKCYEVQDLETKEIFAAKIVSKASIAKPRAYAKLRSEIAIHRELSHEKVVKFFNYFEDTEHVYILLEVCPNQTLNEFMRRRPLKRLSEPEAIFYVHELITALQYLHRRRVIHRDLKLGNLFLDQNMRLKVGDFGLAAQLDFDGERKRTICGTPNYLAPEILEGKYGHSFEVDIWSLGVIIYTMIIGRPPFETSDVKTTYKRIQLNQYSFPETVWISPQAKDLIGRILQTDPGTRPGLEEILASSWLRSGRMPPTMPESVSLCSVSPRVQESSAVRATSARCLRLPDRDDRQVLESRRESRLCEPLSSRRAKCEKQERFEVQEVQPARPEIWVTKWVDYASKYGVGYVLSDGSIGVHFNDSTKIILVPNGTHFDYVTRRTKEKPEERATYSWEGFPEDLKKKVTLLRHFKNYMMTDILERKDGASAGESSLKVAKLSNKAKVVSAPGQVPFVKKWTRNKHAIMFQLSNKTVQVIFFDKTEAVLSSRSHTVTYVDKKGQVQAYPLTNVLDVPNAELAKRLKYTKDILRLSCD